MTGQAGRDAEVPEVDIQYLLDRLPAIQPSDFISVALLDFQALQLQRRCQQSVFYRPGIQGQVNRAHPCVLGKPPNRGLDPVYDVISHG
jgi:hypothetical protein